MPKSVAIMLDGGFVLKKLNRQHHTARDIYHFALSCIIPTEEEIFRIFFYHCAPYEGTVSHPITGQLIDFANTPIARDNKKLLQELSEMNFVAVRKGLLQLQGWAISSFATNRLQRSTSEQIAATSQNASETSPLTTPTITPPPTITQNLSPNDFTPDFKQKEVDIKIGLDVALLSSKRTADKIILVTGDTDLVPAMKFARREGVQVIIANLTGNVQGRRNYLKSVLKEHADEVRTLCYDNQTNSWTTSSL